MRKGLFVVAVATCLLAPPALGHAQESSPAKPASAKTAPASPVPAQLPPDEAARASAAESRYRAWVDQEHAKDATAFQQERSRIEDKYKGYVRPKHEKKDAKKRPAPSATKDN